MSANVRLARLLAGALLVFSTLAACVPAGSMPGQSAAAPGASPTAAAAAAPSPASPGTKPVQLSIWHAYGGALGKAFDALVQQFNQTHPAIQVAATYGGTLFTMREKLTTAIAGNAAPDISQIDQFWSSELADAGAIVSLDDYIAADKTIDPADIWDKAWETARYQGKTWSMPFSLSNIALYYNRDLFRQAGLDPERPPATWEALRDAAARLTVDKNGDGTPEQWGLTVPLKADQGNVYYWLAFLWQNDGHLFGDDLKTVRFQEEPGVEALQYWIDLVKKDKSIPLTPPANGFESGQIAMNIASTARLQTYIAALGADRLGMAPLPAHKTAATGVGGANLAILSTAKDRQAAWEFIRWMSNPETNLAWSMQTGYLPLRQSVVQSATYQAYVKQTPQAQVILDTMSTAVVRPNIPAYTPVSREIGLAIEQALYNDVDAAAALDAAAARSAQYLK